MQNDKHTRDVFIHGLTQDICRLPTAYIVQLQQQVNALKAALEEDDYIEAAFSAMGAEAWDE